VERYVSEMHEIVMLSSILQAYCKLVNLLFTVIVYGDPGYPAGYGFDDEACG
jgi:hypothetical protein